MNSYNIFCGQCSFKKITKTLDDLKEFKIIPSSPVQRNLPKIDPITYKVQNSTQLELPKKIRCPKCGFAIRPKLVKQEKKDEQ